VLAGELPRQLVEAPHALDRDEECLVVVEANLGQLGDPAAQVVLELFGVGAVQLTAPVQLSAPFGDLGLQI
jgi:hypothetical protein